VFGNAESSRIGTRCGGRRPELHAAYVGMGFRACMRTLEFGKPEGRTADPSTTLRSGRDDNFVWERSV